MNRTKGIQRAAKKMSETFLDRYKQKVSEAANSTTGPEPMHKVPPQPGHSVQAPKEIKQSVEKSATPDTSKLDRKTAPKENDGVHAIKHNEKSEDKSEKQAASTNKGDVNQKPAVKESRFGDVSVLETRKPISIRDALAMMESREEHYRLGTPYAATPPQQYDDNWSGQARAWAQRHEVETPSVTDIDDVHAANKQEIEASLRRTVDYRQNDQQIGDKKPVGNDGK